VDWLEVGTMGAVVLVKAADGDEVAAPSVVATLGTLVGGLALGEETVEISGELGAIVVPGTDVVAGFLLGNVTAFGFTLSTIARRFFSTSEKALSLLKPFSCLAI